eukprot:TRINITY_DN13916_c0_g1_i1.p1 TRINITY_DN13916_c0_g1~~TRINITY_DN13916_c0_g1_i1.p1  ORF type:complete len:239 (-),score=19.80 TRINITY_DN13916_c0_g1_i1:156-839(-)
MAGMSMPNFSPERYVGRWYEVASLKRGFAGQGQEDCHCTQGVYTFDADKNSIEVDTFCFHGSPKGYMTGIRGKVQCVADDQLGKVETELESVQMIKGKCFLRFPTLPFIPKEPYDVLATDYDTYALVSGARDTSFVQVYSRTPDPGPQFIEKYRNYLANLGYNKAGIRDTPQDCDSVSLDQLMQMMSQPKMEQAMTNVLPSPEPDKVNPTTSLWDTIKQLIDLYFGL